MSLATTTVFSGELLASTYLRWEADDSMTNLYEVMESA